MGRDMNDSFERIHHCPAQGQLLFYGDSDIAYWKNLDKQFQPGVLRCGVPGAEMGDVVRYAPRMLEKYRPSVIVCVAGENDIGAGASPEAVCQLYVQFCDLVAAALPGTPLLYISTKREPATADLQPQYQRLNELVREASSTRDGVTYIDCYSKMEDARQRPIAKYYGPDGLHLSREGYAFWAELVKEAMLHVKPQKGACK